MNEIARFLHEHPPFSELPLEQVQTIATTIQIEYFPANHDILVYGGPPGQYLYIVRRGSVDMLREDGADIEVFDTLGEGEYFGQLTLIRKKPPLLTVRTREETLAYLLPASDFERLRREVPAFAQFFPNTMIKRLAQALETHHEQASPELFRAHMGDIIRYALMVDPSTTVAEAAQKMSEDDVSCVVVTSTPPGIMSDRDLRNRVVSAGISYDTPVSKVMTSPILTLPSHSLVFEGLMMMVERNINHIPITEGDSIIGVVTHTDILRQQSRSPLVLPHLLERARTTNDLYAYTQQVDNTAGALLEEGARASDIGRLVAIANDALIVHLLKQAEHEFGPPPCAYAWLVMGSEGRLEQTVRTDQDNALVYANDAPAEAESYFERLTGHVVEQLIACGFPPCPGDIMATNPQWRQPLHVWQNYFERWINNPNEEALLRSAIFFDYRKVHGALDIESALRPVIREGRSNRIFLGRMARNLLRQTPPLGMFRNFVLEKSGESRDLLDLKERGVAIIVDLARLYALEAGSSESNTLARLRTSAGKSSLDKANAEKLTSAFELMSLFRIRHQYQQIGRNEEPDNLVPVSSLSKLEQRDLKEAFRAVATSQRSVEFTFQTSMFG